VTESDVTGSYVTGSDVIRPKVGDSPRGMILIVRGVVYSKKARMHFRACAEYTSGNDVTSGQVTSCDVIPVRAASGDVTSSNACVMARSPLLPPNYALTPCCGLEVHYPTYSFTSVKDPGNTFNLNPKWARTLPSLIYFSWVIYRVPPNSKVLAHFGLKLKILPGSLTDLSA
jgi:hypothetical protein